MHRVKAQAKRTKVVGYFGVLVTGVGLAVSIRKRLGHYNAFDIVSAKSTEIDRLPSPQPNLRLKQVQVFFRHGARTPLYLLEGYPQVSYHVDQHMRPHQLAVFPIERVSNDTLKPIDWSAYEYHLRSLDLLRGGAQAGNLTSFGQEQLYSLGMRIKEEYGHLLPLGSYSPETTYVLSTNINRTVESACCLLAGVFGKEELKKYAAQHGPVKIRVVVVGNNVLIPDTGLCSVLKDVNRAAMLHFDVSPPMKKMREEIEKYIDKQHDEHQRILAKAQSKLSQYFSSTSKNKSCSHLSFNSDRQLVHYDPDLISLLRNRDLAIAVVDKFWHNVICHHPVFAGHLSKDEMRALAYLTKMEVEEFTLNLSKGHRFKFHFDSSNPFFHNTVLCKEIVHLPPSGGTERITSKSTPIRWKEGKQPKSQTQTLDENSSGVSFFGWYSDPVHSGHDTIGTALKDQIWKNPLDFYSHVSYAMDHSTTKKINFVYLRDDMVARETHGWNYPHDLRHIKGMPERNATKMLYQAMSGRNHLERPVVTRLATGRLLKDMVDRMEACIEGRSKTHLVLYSSHDSTMTALLEALDIWDNEWPPFGADVRLELYQDRDSEEHYIKVLYNGRETKVRDQSSSLVKLSDFLAAIKSYTIDQETFEKICASSFLEQVAQDVLAHEDGEKQDDEESVQMSETPAGM